MTSEMAYNTVKVQEDFYVIAQRGVKCFLFVGTDYALLVDTGFGGDLMAEVRKITDKPIKLVLTHSDGDHVAADSQFPEKYMHPSEFYTYIKKNKRPSVCLPIWEGDIIDLGNFRFEVILIPGHTPGSIALLEREKRFILGGDTMQDNAIYMFGEGRDLAAFRCSMAKLMAIQDDFDVIYPSHGNMTAPKSVLKEHYDLAGEILDGIWPEPQPAPAHMPESVKLWQKGEARLYLEK